MDRSLSASVFNNDKMIEVVLCLDRWDQTTATAQELARELRINHDLVKKVLVRLEAVDLVKAGQRIGGRRGALPYEVARSVTWSALVALCEALVGRRSS